MQENFLTPMICIKPPLVGFLERNSIFNFDKMVPTWLRENSYGFTSVAHLFLKQSSQIEKFLPMRQTTAGAGETKSGIYIRQW